MKKNSQVHATTHEIITELMQRQAFYPATIDANLFVSSKSRWNDRYWQLDNATSGARPEASRIYWDFSLPDGSKFTDIQHKNFLEDARRFVWSLFTDPRNSRSLKTANASLIYTSLKTLVWFMQSHNYANFGELNNRASELFIEFLRNETEDNILHNSINEKAVKEFNQIGVDILELASFSDDNNSTFDRTVFEEEEADELTYTYVYPRLVIWKRLWDQRDAMRSAGISPILEEPFQGKTIRQAALELAVNSIKVIPAMPDEIAIPIMNRAAEFVESGGGDLIRMSKEALANRINIFGSASASTDWKKGDRKKATKALSAFKFSTPVGMTQPWHISLAEVDAPSRVLRSLLDKMVTASSIVLQSESGMRISEVMSIRAGVNPSTGEPSCLRRTFSRSGMLELFYVTGYLSKTRSVPEKAEWLLAARPRGSTVVPIAIRAIEVMQEMFEPFRQMSSDEEVNNFLFISLGTANGLPTTGEGLKRALSTTILGQQKRFSAEAIEWDKLPLDAALDPYKESRCMCIKTHQWRKNYARFVFQTNRKMIPAIARQFKHLSIAMTEQAYIGTEISLIDDVAEANRNMAIDIVLQKARGRGPKLQGRLSKMLDKYQDQISTMVKGKTYREARKSVESWCTQRDLKLFFHGYGSCIPGLAPMEAECHKRAQTVHWANKEPNYAFREPSICTGCHLFLASEETFDYWSTRYVKNMTAWTMAKERGEEKQYRVAKLRAEQSATYLQFWNISLPDLNNSGTLNNG